MSATSTPGPNGVAVSAPGKVLLAGGYLVLDRRHTALVFGLDARIHVHVQRLAFNDTPSYTAVRSPQFKDAEWTYYDHPAGVQGGDGGVCLTQDAPSNQNRNPFIEVTLAYVYTYIRRVASVDSFGPTLITILADEDYYSQSQSQSQSSAEPNSLPTKPFPHFGVPLKQAHKTGLGSSAALVTALTTALLLFHIFKPEELRHGGTKARIHNLAQAAHCAAQGKVGSGFDIAAAVYGSCIYRRFSPSILESIGDPGSVNFAERLFNVVEDLEPGQMWDVEISRAAVQVPGKIRLVMCDVDCGSETPGMVKKLLSWRKDNQEEAGALWAALQQGSEELAGELRRLSKLCDSPDQDYSNLRNIILANRSLIREMSAKSGVPVEPKVQTELIDACSAIPGVIGGVVPGAGGFDAITLLVLDQESVFDELRRLFATWRSSVEEGDGPKIGTVRLLGVKQDLEGIRIELNSTYGSWTQANGPTM